MLNIATRIFSNRFAIGTRSKYLLRMIPEFGIFLLQILKFIFGHNRILLCYCVRCRILKLCVIYVIDLEDASTESFEIITSKFESIWPFKLEIVVSFRNLTYLVNFFISISYNWTSKEILTVIIIVIYP